MKTFFAPWKLIFLSANVLVLPLHALEFGNIEITQNNSSNSNQDSATPAVNAVLAGGSTSGTIIVGHNRGDIDMDFGGGPDDVENGIVITSVSENSRNNFAGGDSVDGLNFATTSIAFFNGISGGYFVPTHDMGGSAQDVGGRSEYNINLAVGYFPYEDWLGAHANQAANGGPLTEVRGSAGIALSNQILDNGNGIFTVNLSALTAGGNPATPGNGVLLTVHGKNEGNFTMGQDNGDGTFTVSIMDNGTFGGDVSYEQDTIGFVYIPTTAAGPHLVTAVGRAQSDGTTEVSGGSFTVTPRRSLTSLNNVLAEGTFEADLMDAEATFTTVLDDFANKTYVLEILSGPAVGSFVEITGAPSDTGLTTEIALGAGAVNYRLGEAGYEWLLEIPGKSPENGTLLVSPEGGFSSEDPLPFNTDNFVTYQWDATAGLEGAWVVQSRDVPEGFLTQTGADPGDDVFSFVFLTTDPANAQPTIALTSPAPGTQISLGSMVNLTAEAADEAPGAVSNVEFFVNGESVGMDPTAPYELSVGPFDSLQNPVIRAVVTDSDGAKASTPEVSVSVIPPSGSGGLYFNGLDQYVTFGDAPALQLETFTLETWFKPEGTFGEGVGLGGSTAIPLLTKGRGEAEQSNRDMNFFFGIRESDGVLVAEFEDSLLGLNVPVLGVTPVTSSVWQHAAVTFDGTAWRLYLNGNLEAVQDAGGLTPRADSIQHAALGSALNSLGVADGFFQGFLDEARIWSVARSQSEIRQTCNSELPSATGMVARWGMSEGSGSTLAGGVTGSLVAGPVWSAGNSFTNNAKPGVNLLQPEDGTRFELNATVELEATASDSDGTVNQVEFFDNGVSLGVDSDPPYTTSFVAATPGARSLTAVATDSGGATSRSNFAVVNVTLPAPEIPGYTVGVIDGGSLDIDTPEYVPPANGAFSFFVEQATAAPLAFDAPNDNRGDFQVSINGALVPFASGLMMMTNHPTLENLASLDNNLSAVNSSGNYWVSIEDNEGPGAVDPATPEESGRFSLGFFPFANGWFGANVDPDGAVLDGSANFPAGASVTVTNTDTGTYEIGGLPTVGNFIPVGVGNGLDNVISVGLNGANWVVQSRDNGGGLENGTFGFLYVPVQTRQVLSGLVQNDGTLVPLNDELEILGASVNPGAQGYEITFGDGSVINPGNSAMFLAGDFDHGNGDDNIYSYFANGDTFVVFSQDLPGLNSAFQQGGFRFIVTPLDPVVLSGDEVVVVASDPSATEGGDDGAFTFTRFGDTGSQLTVPFTVSGNATSGVDFAPLPGSVTFEVGAGSATVSVAALTDGFLELSENVTVTILPGTGYSLGAYTTATVSIVNVNPTVDTETVAFQEGVNGYTGQFGMRIGESIDSVTGEYLKQLGSSVQHYFMDGLPGNASVDTNGIVRFDGIFGEGPGQIPPGAGIQDAQLIMTTSTVGDAQSPGPYIVDRLIVPADESTTYGELQVGMLGDGFEGVRGSVTGLPVAGFGAIDSGEVVAANVTALVQNWSSALVDPFYDAPNYGFAIFTGGTTNGWSYNTVGNVNPELRPKLVVTYTTDTTLKYYYYVADLNAIINNQQGIANPNPPSVDGSLYETQFLDLNDPNAGTTEALLRFPITFGDPGDLNTIPDGETVIKAELLITTNGPLVGGSTNAQSAGPYAIHQMVVDWDTMTAFGLTGPVVPNEIDDAAARVEGMGQLSATFGDITSVVQNWRAGAPNYGVNLKPETADGWQPFWLGILDNPGLASTAPLLRVTTAILESTLFDNYMASNGATGANFLDDRDRDKIAGLLEYALGLNPIGMDLLPELVASGDDFTLTFMKGAEAAGDPRVSYLIETSPDCQVWSLADEVVESPTQITATIPGAGPGRPMFYARLRIAYVP